MMFAIETLREYAQKTHPEIQPHVTAFLNDLEALARQEVERAKKCLEDYGYTVNPPPPAAPKW